jgi:hypothetical protein
MTKAKKTKAPQRRTELDRIVTQLRTILRRDTTSVIEKGKLLLRSRELLANEYGEWMPWLEKNFDLSYRTAINYCHAAEYVARKSKSATVANFANLSPTVLYRLAEGDFAIDVEAAILAASREGRVDEDAMWAICEKLALPDADDADDGDDQDDGHQDDGDDGAEDAESKAILDGPPPTPPPAPDLTPPDFALRDFDQAITTLKRLMGKPSAQFARTAHSVEDLENVEGFIHAVMGVRRQ